MTHVIDGLAKFLRLQPMDLMALIMIVWSGFQIKKALPNWKNLSGPDKRTFFSVIIGAILLTAASVAIHVIGQGVS